MTSTYESAHFAPAPAPSSTTMYRSPSNKGVYSLSFDEYGREILRPHVSYVSQAQAQAQATFGHASDNQAQAVFGHGSNNQPVASATGWLEPSYVGQAPAHQRNVIDDAERLYDSHPRPQTSEHYHTRPATHYHHTYGADEVNTVEDVVDPTTQGYDNDRRSSTQGYDNDRRPSTHAYDTDRRPSTQGYDGNRRHSSDLHGHGLDLFEEYDGAAHLYDNHQNRTPLTGHDYVGPSHATRPSLSNTLARPQTYFETGQNAFLRGDSSDSTTPAAGKLNVTRASSFSIGEHNRPRNPWSPHDVYASQPPAESYEERPVQIHPDAGLRDAEIYGQNGYGIEPFSLLENRGQAEVSYAPVTQADYDVADAYDPRRPSFVVDESLDHQHPAFEGRHPVGPMSPASPLPPSPPSESGVHLSAWLAECVWSLLIHPYQPERFGEEELQAETAAGYGQMHISRLAGGHNLYYNPYGLRSKPSQAFGDFVHRTLSQTLLSSTAVVLSLWYIRRFAVHAEGGSDGRRLRQLLMESAVQGRGAEEVARRVLVLGLACSNKWLDDNTFTNKSWSDVTDLPLAEINRLEMLALGPISFDLSVDTRLWTKWLYEIHSHVSPFVTDSKLVSEAIRTMFMALAAHEERFDFEIAGPRERVRWAEAELDHLMAGRLYALAHSSPLFGPQQPPTTPTHPLQLDYNAAAHHDDSYVATAQIGSGAMQDGYYAPLHSGSSASYAYGSRKEKVTGTTPASTSGYGQTISQLWHNYLSGPPTAVDHSPYGVLPPLRNLTAVMA